MSRAPAAPSHAAKRARHDADEAAPDDAQIILRYWREAVPDDRLAHLVKDATRALVRALQLRLARHGVPFGHWAFLRILWERDGLTQRALSREAGVMEPTAHAALIAMERRGYVVRRKLPDNRRDVHVFLTPRGRALKRVLVPLAEDVNRVAVEHVPAADLGATRATLLAIIDNLARDAPAATAGAPPRRMSRATTRRER
jgi:DNA-binding MarR family transcriptional regulator